MFSPGRRSASLVLGYYRLAFVLNYHAVLRAKARALFPYLASFVWSEYPARKGA